MKIVVILIFAAVLALLWADAGLRIGNASLRKRVRLLERVQESEFAAPGPHGCMIYQLETNDPHETEFAPKHKW